MRQGARLRSVAPADGGTADVAGGEGRGVATTVLVIDDEPMVREVIAATLTSRGDYRTHTPELDVWRSTATELRPDVVLVDLQLGALHGADVVRQLLRDCPGSMIAVLTGLPAEDQEEHLRAIGAFAYYEKATLTDLPEHLREDLDLFHRALDGEDVIAPSAIQRRTPPTALQG
jgi:DNA-binding NarL/FixJ family response regulator